MIWIQAVSIEQQQRIAGALVDALADKDTGVSCDAAAALQTYGSNEQGVLVMLCMVFAVTAPVIRVQ